VGSVLVVKTAALTVKPVSESKTGKNRWKLGVMYRISA
jgi:hypothetical protein